MTPQQLQTIFRHCPADKIAAFAPALDKAMLDGGLDSVIRQACFLGQIGFESNELIEWEEDLDHSATDLMATWPHLFNTIELANRYAHKPEAIANFAYANRGGNGNEESGDGWLYRGRGPIEITLKDGYAATTARIGAALGVDLVANPSRAADPDVGFAIAVDIWNQKHLSLFADKLVGLVPFDLTAAKLTPQSTQFAPITHAINGAATIGPPSYHERRMRYTTVCLQVLAQG